MSVASARLPKTSLFDLFLPTSRIFEARRDRAAGRALIQVRRSVRPQDPPIAPEPETPKSEVKPAEEHRTNDQVKKDTAEQANTFTPEQDAQLSKMKIEGKTWKEIVAVTGIPKVVLHARHKQLRATEDEGKNRPVAKAVPESNPTSAPVVVVVSAEPPGMTTATTKPHSKPASTKSASRKADPAPPAASKQSSVRRASVRPRSAHSSSRSAAAAAAEDARKQRLEREKEQQPRFTIDEWIALTQDREFNPQDLNTLGRLLDDDSHERWERIASRYFDVTGRRVAGGYIRDRFGGGGGGGCGI